MVWYSYIDYVTQQGANHWLRSWKISVQEWFRDGSELTENSRTIYDCIMMIDGPEIFQ